MVDAVRVYAPGEPVTDPITGEVTDGETLVYEGRAKVQSNTAMAGNPEAGGQLFTVERKELHVPALTPGLDVGQMVTVLASALQPTIVGETYRLTEPSGKSWQTAQRWVVTREA